MQPVPDQSLSLVLELDRTQWVARVSIPIPRLTAVKLLIRLLAIQLTRPPLSALRTPPSALGTPPLSFALLRSPPSALPGDLSRPIVDLASPPPLRFVHVSQWPP